MEKTMNIAEMTDLTQLKALAYDNVVLAEQASNNLRMLNARINQVQTQENEKFSDEPGDTQPDA